MKKLFHTPEGVRDIYQNECKEKIALENRLHSVFTSYGYEDIETPTFEYFDVFSREVGTIPSKDLYKFFDREGNTLVLRPDFTPSIARAAVMYFLEEDMPIRLCYKGNTFVNNSSYQGRLKESTQMGVELIGDASVDSDGELIAMTVRTLKEAGLTEFQVSIGQVDFFKSLIEEANISEETTENLRSLISNKNFFGVEELLSRLNISEELEHAFLTLPKLFGSTEILDSAKKLTKNPKAIQAIERLEEIYKVLTYYNCEKYISFDLGMLSKYHYYTGIIFQAYTYGTGEPVVKGGRYNALLEHFGKKAPAIGFGIVMESLMNAISRQNIKIDVTSLKSLILYNREQLKFAISLGDTYRQQGIPAELLPFDSNYSLDAYKKYGERTNISHILVPEGLESYQIVNLQDDSIKVFTKEELLQKVEKGK